MKNRIKDQREDHDYTQQWPDELLVRLANFYQTSVDNLLLLTDEPRPYPPIYRLFPQKQTRARLNAPARPSIPQILNPSFYRFATARAR